MQAAQVIINRSHAWQTSLTSVFGKIVYFFSREAFKLTEYQSSKFKKALLYYYSHIVMISNYDHLCMHHQVGLHI